MINTFFGVIILLKAVLNLVNLVFLVSKSSKNYKTNKNVIKPQYIKININFLSILPIYRQIGSWNWPKLKQLSAIYSKDRVFDTGEYFYLMRF